MAGQCRRVANHHVFMQVSPSAYAKTNTTGSGGQLPPYRQGTAETEIAGVSCHDS